MAAVDCVETRYTGVRLDQGDLDVWESVLHAVRLQELGSECRLTSYALLKLMGKTDTGKNRATLHTRITRFVANALEREFSKNTPYRHEPTLPDMNSTSEQLRFPSIPGHSIRAEFDGGGLSSDLEPLLLRGVDRQIGLTERLTAALVDRRHAGYVTHSHAALLAQRIDQIGCGYEDGNDCDSLRHDPMFKLGTGRLPFDGGDDIAL